MNATIRPVSAGLRPTRTRRRPWPAALTACLLAVIQISAMPQSPAPLLVAHRGASFDAPENTLAAIRLGWEQDADAVEIDVHLTRDRQIVACHDATLKRTCGAEGRIADMTLAELRKLDAGRWKGQQWAEEPLPTLDEALATIPPGKRMLVEVKCGPEIVPELLAAFDRSGRAHAQTIVISFSAAVCAAVKAERPTVPVFLLRSFDRDGESDRWKPTIDDVVSEALSLGVDGVDLQAVAPALRPDAVKTIRAARLELHAWTVDDAKVARQLVALGYDSITTNRPAWLREQLERRVAQER